MKEIDPKTPVGKVFYRAFGINPHAAPQPEDGKKVAWKELKQDAENRFVDPPDTKGQRICRHYWLI